MKHLHYIYTLLFGVAVVLFFGLVYPHHLHYQEHYQLFLFDRAYAWEIIKLPGGIADLLGRFCTQFFLFAWVGALIIGIMLSVVQLLTRQLVNSSTSEVTESSMGWLYGLSYVPSFLLWLFILDENALLGGVWAMLLTLFVSWLFSYFSHDWIRRITIFLAIPTLYWIAGPVSLLFFLLHIIGTALSNTKSKENWIISIVPLILLALMPVVLSHYLPIPADKLWFGIHYYRYPTEVPVLLWAACLSVFILTLVARACQKWSTSSHYVVVLCSFVLVAVGMGTLVWKNSNFKAEKVMQYDFMACHQQWNRILETINKEKPNNQIGVTVQNLALAMRGILVNHLFDYNQNGIAGLLPDVDRDATSPMPTAEAFYQLGMIHVAQRTVFEAQEAILDFQKSARCYKRLAQTNLIIGSYEVARKYLMALQKTLFYREWADETLLLLGNEQAIAKHPEYGRLRQFAYNEDFYFSDHVTPEMLESLYFSNTENHLAFEYLKAYYVLTGDRERYAKLLLHTSNKQ